METDRKELMALERFPPLVRPKWNPQVVDEG
jgi:hypothetical protein